MWKYLTGILIAFSLFYWRNKISLKFNNNQKDPDSILANKIQRAESDRNSNIIFLVDEFWGKKKKKISKLKKYIIDIEDEDQFMRRMSDLKHTKIEIILHTNGGCLESSELIATCLRDHHNYNRAVHTYVPEYAFSAGTFIALTGKLHMNRYAYLGPTDPQITYEETEHTDSSTSSKVLIDAMNSKVELGANLFIKCAEARILHADNKRMTKESLQLTQNLHTSNILSTLTSGNIPHHKPLGKQYLMGEGFYINDIDDGINELFREFRKFRDSF